MSLLFFFGSCLTLFSLEKKNIQQLNRQSLNLFIIARCYWKCNFPLLWTFIIMYVCWLVSWLVRWLVWEVKLWYPIGELVYMHDFWLQSSGRSRKKLLREQKFAIFLLNLRMLIELFALRRKKITTVNNLPNDLFVLLFLAGIIIFWKFENQGNTILTTLNSLLFVLTVC